MQIEIKQTDSFKFQTAHGKKPHQELPEGIQPVEQLSRKRHLWQKKHETDATEGIMKRERKGGTGQISNDFW